MTRIASPLSGYAGGGDVFASQAAGQLARELDPRCDAELSEHLAQVVVHGPRADEKLLTTTGARRLEGRLPRACAVRQRASYLFLRYRLRSRETHGLQPGITPVPADQ